MKHATIPCPCCQTAIELRVYLSRIGRFECHCCSTRGLGLVRKNTDDQPIEDGEIGIHDLRDDT